MSGSIEYCVAACILFLKRDYGRIVICVVGLCIMMSVVYCRIFNIYPRFSPEKSSSTVFCPVGPEPYYLCLRWWNWWRVIAGVTSQRIIIANKWAVTDQSCGDFWSFSVVLPLPLETTFCCPSWIVLTWLMSHRCRFVLHTMHCCFIKFVVRLVLYYCQWATTTMIMIATEFLDEMEDACDKLWSTG